MGRIQAEQQEFELSDDVDVIQAPPDDLDTDTHGMPVVDVIQRMPNVVGIGVDIGMTFSGASIYYRPQNGAATRVVIPCGRDAGRQASAKFESVIFEPADGSERSVGHQAVVRAGSNEPGRPYSLFKRYLGVPLNQQPPDNRQDAKQLTTELLIYIKEQVDAYLSKHFDLTRTRPVYRFTLPGMWEQEKIRAFNDAIRAAGFTEGYGVVEEPVAMAVAASRLGLSPRLRSQHRRFVLVCDFGGGTFDVALISTDPSQVVATKAAASGNGDLGMSNLDKAIELLVLKKRAFITEDEYQSVLGAGVIAGQAFERLWATARARVLKDPILLFKMHSVCEQLKQEICSQWDAGAAGVAGQVMRRSWPATLPAGEEIDITREEVAPLIKAMQDTAAQALRTYLNKTLSNIPDLPDFDPRSIGLVLVGGGGALLPGIEHALREMLPGHSAQVVNVTRKAELDRRSGIPEHALGLVQLGAAMVAAEPSLLQERRAPASFGIAVRRFLSDEKPKYADYMRTVRTDYYGGQAEQTYIAYQRFFQKNAALPMEPVEIDVSPQRSDQREYHVRIYTGEDEDYRNNQLLGIVHARLPAMATTHDQIKVVCFLGGDGEFHVEGRDWTNAVSPEVRLQLNDDGI